MLIPAAISLIVSTIILNLNFLVNGAPAIRAENAVDKNGRVLGVSESRGLGSVIIESGDGLNKAVVKVIEEMSSVPLPKLRQLPRLDQPMRQLPQNQAKPAEPVIMDYELPAENGAILDCQDDNLFFAKRPDRQWPIASITKLFTTYAFLDYNPGWETVYQIKASDKREGGKIYLFTGDKVKVKDLFYFSLVGSDNTATAALISSTGLSEPEFVEKMNDKMKVLGLKNTRLVDVAGLHNGNISTAREIAQFAKIALANSEISRASVTKKYEFITEQGKKKTIASTNLLLSSFPQGGVNILGGKTGYVNSSGYCLVSQFKNREGEEIVTVVLGASSENSRFDLTKKLVDLYYGRKQ